MEKIWSTHPKYSEDYILLHGKKFGGIELLSLNARGIIEFFNEDVRQAGMENKYRWDSSLPLVIRSRTRRGGFLE